ncbi:hypothetical protein ACQKMD_09155 [Viridibacillus sp. NPDC096237]|uniref:hypothetical protein n=1 Tax=Viridibacillus sp. NPDC096237 TaxID=3390721 RepID=UPI003CFBCBF7
MDNHEDVLYGFLASDEARFVTGSELIIYGGWTTEALHPGSNSSNSEFSFGGGD